MIFRLTCISANMKQVVDFNNPKFVETVKQTYLIQYLKDTMMLLHLDELTQSTLNTIIFINHVQIISYLTEERTILKELFTKINECIEAKMEDKGTTSAYCCLT